MKAVSFPSTISGDDQIIIEVAAVQSDGSEGPTGQSAPIGWNPDGFWDPVVYDDDETTFDDVENADDGSVFASARLMALPPDGGAPLANCFGYKAQAQTPVPPHAAVLNLDIRRKSKSNGVPGLAMQWGVQIPRAIRTDLELDQATMQSASFRINGTPINNYHTPRLEPAFYRFHADIRRINFIGRKKDRLLRSGDVFQMRVRVEADGVTASGAVTHLQGVILAGKGGEGCEVRP
jgi:hypothetical protein